MVKVFLTGGSGMLGSAIVRLQHKAPEPWDIIAPTRSELDLTDRNAVRAFFATHDFDLVLHCAAKVGGIQANMNDPVGFYADNTQINLNVIEEARLASVSKLIFFGSSCMYPKDLGRTLSEDDILSAPLEPTNEGYALAKISAARHCAYISDQYGLAYKTLIPCNLYGPGDYFEPERSHLLAAIIAKTHKAVEERAASIEIWGDGRALREFIYIDDLAEFVLDSYKRMADFPAMLNVGYGSDHSVLECYKAAAEIIGYSGAFHHKLDAPVGMQRKLMDSTRAKTFGWGPQTDLKTGLAKTYEYFLSLQDYSARQIRSVSN